jgi:hypothetical protein
MKRQIIAALGLFAAVLVTGGLGCELITAPDRSKIDNLGGSGGATGGGGTGGATGGGGTGGVTGGGGTGGTTGTPCETPADCDPPNVCVDATCEMGFCAFAAKPNGPQAVQTPADCKVSQCTNGLPMDVDDDADLPDDGKDCTVDLCNGGEPSHTNAPADTGCGVNLALKCDGAGNCVDCLAAADCGADTECQQNTCTAGVCGVINVAQGTPLATQTDGDCQLEQCDGNGSTESVDDNADIPADATTCTNDVCVLGVPSNIPVAANTACSEGTGSLCDGFGLCVECVAATDCAGVDDECGTRTCVGGVCGKIFAPANTSVSSQTAKDCKKSVCDGAGTIVVANDDTDLPDDNNTCTTDTCSMGAPTFTNKASGTSCGAAQVCDGGGQCVGCNAPTDCAGVDDECKVRTCVANVCGFNFTANGTAVAMQSANDCKKNVCDGSGNVVNQNDNADLPLDDANQCTSEACNAGVPTHPAQPVDTACNQNGGSFCSAAGACVVCNAAAQCPGSDTECQTRTCSANTCGFSFQPNGFATPTQVSGDCKVRQCDGAGAFVQANSNGDLPADDANQCTDEVCSAGVPSHPAKAVDTVCSQNGGSFCSAAGACVQCNAPAQCAGSDTECQTRTCSANTCGFNFQPNGTPTASQTTGDCKENQCDGAGAIVAANKDTDLPADDGNQCTGEVCTAGVASHPAKAVDTACSQNGGSFCSAAGACVECNAPAQCAGSDTECQTRTCSANTCGFNFQPNGTPTASQTTGDCKENQCNGAGAIVAANKDTDLPADDGSQCTDEVCTSGVASHPAKAVDTACSQNGGSFCSAAGTCVQCNAPAQCPGSDTECQSRTCNSNACGTSFQPNGHVVATQTTGDCKENQCDGAGATVSANKDADLPVDGNQCTDDVCTSGAPTNPNLPAGTTCSQNGGTTCDASGSCVAAACNDNTKNGTESDIDCGGSCAPCALTKTCNGNADCASNACAGGVCVECLGAASCPGTDNACQTRTCNANVCGLDFQPNGTVIASQTTGDCQENQCDGAGAIVSVAKNTDVPADDGNQCTDDTCVAGAPVHPAKAVDTACSQNGGSFCSAAGACVQCNAPTQCPGTDNACQTRTCASNVCGLDLQPLGTVIASQTTGDCQENQCDGAGAIVSVAKNTDLPADDGFECTSEACVAGVPLHPNEPADTSCTQAGGSFCNGAGACVQCNTAPQCGTDTECVTFACSVVGACSSNNTAAGFVTSSQTTGDCKENQCDGAGAIAPTNKDTDLPVDGNQCTDDVCTAGVPTNPSFPLGTTCSQSGGTVCNGTGTCVVQPSVTSTTPADGGAGVAITSAIAVTFSQAMSTATLTGQIAAGACSGSIQVSSNDFKDCIGFTAAAPVMSGGDTIATLTPVGPGRLYAGTTYRVRVLATAANATNIPMAATYTSATGFVTLSGANACDGNLVISQVYGAGGNSGATFKNDFVELHNRGTTSVDLTGLSLQYANTNTTVWNSGGVGIALLSGTIPAGGYFLVQLAGGATGANLPTPDLIPAVALTLGGTNGKIALINGTTQIPNGNCPPAASTIDLVGYGSAECREGTAAAPALSATLSAIRGEAGCADTNANNNNFAGVVPAPRTSATPVSVCTCNSVASELGTSAEVDFCNLQFPTSFTVPPSTTVYGRIFEAGTTEFAGATSNIIAQFGYGPNGSNPTTSTAWNWYAATYNTGVGNDDEYQSTVTGATPGTYAYTYRFSFDGLQWTYCDSDGAGANAGLDFSSALLGTMTAN